MISFTHLNNHLHCYVDHVGAGKCSCRCTNAQSCPTLYNPVGWSLPGFSLHGIFQARILEQVAISQVSCVSCIGKWMLYH